MHLEVYEKISSVLAHRSMVALRCWACGMRVTCCVRRFDAGGNWHVGAAFGGAELRLLAGSIGIRECMDSQISVFSRAAEYPVSSRRESPFWLEDVGFG